MQHILLALTDHQLEMDIIATVTLSFNSALIFGRFGIRGWVRKFCHRCYNFVPRHARLLYYTFIERATFFLYNDAN